MKQTYQRETVSLVHRFVHDIVRSCRVSNVVDIFATSRDQLISTVLTKSIIILGACPKIYIQITSSAIAPPDHSKRRFRFTGAITVRAPSSSTCSFPLLGNFGLCCCCDEKLHDEPVMSRIAIDGTKRSHRDECTTKSKWRESMHDCSRTLLCSKLANAADIITD